MFFLSFLITSGFFLRLSTVKLCEVRAVGHAVVLFCLTSEDGKTRAKERPSLSRGGSRKTLSWKCRKITQSFSLISSFFLITETAKLSFWLNAAKCQWFSRTLIYAFLQYWSDEQANRICGLPRKDMPKRIFQDDHSGSIAESGMERD